MIQSIPKIYEENWSKITILFKIIISFFFLTKKKFQIKQDLIY